MTAGKFCVLVVGVCAITSFVADVSLGEAHAAAVAYGATVAGLNALLAVGFSVLGERLRTTRAFFIAVLGGMAFRMAGVLVAIVLGARVLALPKAPLALSFLVLLALFMAGEAWVLHRRFRSREFPSPPFTA